LFPSSDVVGIVWPKFFECMWINHYGSQCSQWADLWYNFSRYLSGAMGPL
jgi:hypothetical protein